MDIKKIIVHSGKFHADDVFCVAMAQIIAERHGHGLEVVRTNNVPNKVEEGTIVCDVGWDKGYTKYDHHQPDAEKREDGKPYAACGLLFRDCWQDLGFPTKESAERYEKSMIIPIELHDNGVEFDHYSATIATFNPNWDSNEKPDEAFMKAVAYVKEQIERDIASAISKEHAKSIVEPALDKMEGKVVTLRQYAPWAETLIPSDAELVIFPSNRNPGHWNVQCVPSGKGEFENKIEGGMLRWIDKDAETGKPTYTPPGCTFVYAKNGFISEFDTLEHAQEAAKALAKAVELEKTVAVYREAIPAYSKYQQEQEEFLYNEYGPEWPALGWAEEYLNESFSKFFADYYTFNAKLEMNETSMSFYILLRECELQKDVKSYRVNDAGKFEIDGSLDLSKIKDADQLTEPLIESVTGTLNLENTGITNIEGIRCAELITPDGQVFSAQEKETEQNEDKTQVFRYVPTEEADINHNGNEEYNETEEEEEEYGN